MAKYAVKVFFETDNLIFSDKVASAIFDAFTEVEDCVTGVDVLTVVGEGPTENDYASDDKWASELVKFRNAGFNDNPLPEGMPEL